MNHSNSQISGKKTRLWGWTLQKLEEEAFKNVFDEFILNATLSIRNSFSQFYSRRANFF